MRVVALEHDVVLADDVEQAQAGVVLDERAEHVVREEPADVGVEVEARRPSARPGSWEAFMSMSKRDAQKRCQAVDDLLGPLQEVGDPADRPLRQGDLEVGKRTKLPLKSQSSSVPAWLAAAE